jgi:subtilase family serine protease
LSARPRFTLTDYDPHAARSRTFTATIQANLTPLPHLILKVDTGNAMVELNDNNNTAAVVSAADGP